LLKRVRGEGFRVQGSGFRVQGSGFRGKRVDWITGWKISLIYKIAAELACISRSQANSAASLFGYHVDLR
jgi:hypothetical protein